MKPNFMGKAANIMADVRNSTCIDDVDAEVINGILQEALNEYYDELHEYYEEEYYIAVASARNIAYDDGHSDGYSEGYENGYADCYDKN